MSKIKHGGRRHSGRQGASRVAMDRMYRIHQLLQNREHPNCTSLAREFEVVTRTIKRDVEFMKLRMGLPVEFDARTNGYHYTKPVEHFPELPLSEAEVFALLVAGKAIAQYRGTPFEEPLQTAFRRLTGQLDQTVKFSLGSLDGVLSFHPFAPEDADLRAFEVITRALTEGRELSFTYRNHGAQVTQRRRVQPYHLACIQNVWYLIGFDVGRSAMRTFALTRVQRPMLLQKRFTVPKTFNAQDYLAGSLGVFKGRDDYEVVVDFDAWAADEIRGRRWHRTQELTELPKGTLRLRLRLNNIEEAEKWLLGYGAHATVVRPQALREKLRVAGEELAKRYGG